VRDVHGANRNFQNIPLDAAAKVLRGERLDRIAVEQFQQAIKSARTLAPYVQTVLATVPGLGTGLSGALGASLALAQGLPITEVVLAAVRGSIPGGALAQAAFDVTAGLVQGKPLDQIALAALPVDPSTKQALARVGQAARALADGKRVDEVALAQLMQQLPPDARKAAQIATALTTAQRAQRMLQGPAPARPVSPRAPQRAPSAYAQRIAQAVKRSPFVPPQKQGQSVAEVAARRLAERVRAREPQAIAALAELSRKARGGDQTAREAVTFIKSVVKRG
jgi:hypothetical protein